MNNKYEMRGDITVIFIMYKGKEYETTISTNKLEKVLSVSNRLGILNPKKSKTMYARFTNGMLLHRFIRDTTADTEIDHFNGNGLDNTDGNLREATSQQNSENISARSNNKSSGLRGVGWKESEQKWIARVRSKSVGQHFIGAYDTVEEANDAVMKARSVLMPFSKEAKSIKFNKSDIALLKPKKKKTVSGIEGICWKSDKELWSYRVTTEEGKRKFIGSSKDLNKVIKMRDEYNLTKKIN